MSYLRGKEIAGIWFPLVRPSFTLGGTGRYCIKEDFDEL
jgi:carbamoylphosphate synthase large subunit